MKTFSAWLPWHAAVKVSVKANSEEEARRIIDNGAWYKEGWLCYQCANHIEIDGGVADYKDLEIYEEAE